MHLKYFPEPMNNGKEGRSVVREGEQKWGSFASLFLGEGWGGRVPLDMLDAAPQRSRDNDDTNWDNVKG